MTENEKPAVTSPPAAGPVTAGPARPPALWKGDAARVALIGLALLLGAFGLVLVAGALAGTVTSDLDTPLLGWGALALAGALAVYLPGRYAIKRAARPARPGQPTVTTGAGLDESGEPSQWETSPSE